ncbi:MAG: 3-hydroxybutyryl-CoA dehydrogenase, partial [Actinobacteria bacterium]
ANRMRLVETCAAEATSPLVSQFLDEFAVSLGKTPVRVASKPAFVVNRCLMPLLNEAVRTLEERVAPAESIDEAVRLGLNHPMGPLALADLIGLDVVVEIMENLARRTGDETYEPRPTLKALVTEGKLGRKTGEGFFSYQR